MWDVWNTSSALVAERLVGQGWTVDALLPGGVPWSESALFNGERLALSAGDDQRIERTLFSHPMDAVFLLGDDQMGWLLPRWHRLPQRVLRHLPPRESVAIALSKRRSLDVAREAGIPVLPTLTCSSEDELRQALREFPRTQELVVKGEHGSAGRTVRATRADPARAAALWRSVAGGSGRVLLQRRLRGPKLILTVVFERGVQRASCAHLKVLSYPHEFGITALGETVHVDAVSSYPRRLMGALGWHGLANLELRQDLEDGHWYFMEMNPRVSSSIGLQQRAGVDVASIWADVCAGRGDRWEGETPYAAGVRYLWAVPFGALLLRRPWLIKHLLGRGSVHSDLSALSGRERLKALRLAIWRAIHE